MFCGAAVAQERPPDARVPVQYAQAIPFFPFGGYERRQPAPRPAARRGTNCGFPWRYSRSLGRCVCLRDGYGLVGGHCVQVTAAEPPSPAGVESVSRGDPGSAADEPSAPKMDAATVQECLKEAGYLQGEVSDRMDKAAWTAFWFFKQDHPVGYTPEGIANERFQRAVFALCPHTAKVGVAPVAAATAGRTDANGRADRSGGVAVAKRKAVRPELECLPDDLYRLTVATYGARRGLQRCEQTCIAVPRDLSKSEIEDFRINRGVSWCQSCVELGAYLPLDEILRLERATNSQICARPPSKLPRWGKPSPAPREPYAKVREIYRGMQPGLDASNRIAVVIGNRTYGHGLPNNAAAHNNAGAVYALLTEHLGYTSENVIDLRDASLKELYEVFGTGEGGELERRAREQPDATVLIYFAGHASTSSDRSDSYILPADAIQYREARTGYPVSQLYASLRRLKAKSVLLLLEASFSRDQSDFVFAPNASEMEVRNLPAEPAVGLTVVAAADRDQKTLDDPEYGIGLFTRYLIEGLAGEADLEPIGNGDHRVDEVELYVYTSHLVRMAARKSYGLLQNPTISRLGNVAVSRF